MKDIILFIVSLAMFMEAIDGTILNTAIPAMASSLAVNPIDLKLALISYLLSLAIFIPISGWLADKFGVKKIFIIALIIFTTSSVWCGMTRSLPELVMARFLQGLGGSLTLPVGRLIIVRTYARHEFIAKMSVVVMIGALGLMLGPVLGGLITQHLSWRWIFWVNIPVGMLAIILAIYLLPSIPHRKVNKLDKVGFILFGSGLASLTLGFAMISESGTQNFLAGPIILMGCILLFSYALHSRKKTHPIIQIELLKYRTFRVSVMGNFFARTGFGGIPFLLPLLLQLGLGYSPQTSGLLLAPMALGVLLVKPLSLTILRIIGYKKLLIGNTFFIALILLSFTLISSQTSLYVVSSLTFLYGFFIALQYTGMNSLAYANISADELSGATSIMSTLQQFSQSFGVAVAALLLRLFAQDFSSNLMLTNHIFHGTFVAMSVLTFFSAIVFIQLEPNDGHELIERPFLAAKSESQI